MQAVASSPERLHSLDAVRGFALTLGVFFHASMSYLPGPQVWMVEDTEQSAVMGATFFTLHMFRMSLFFIIAGFFGRMMIEKRGTAGFVKDRAKRIALPLVAFLPLCLAGIVAATGFAWAIMHPEGATPPTPPQTPTQGGIPFPLTHLWFLYVLLWFYAATVALRALVERLDRKGAFMARLDRDMRRVVCSPFAIVMTAAPFLTALWYAPFWMQWFGIPTPDSNLVPNTPALAAYGAAFGFGWLLQRQMDLLEVFARRWAWNLALAIGFTAACLSIGGLQPILTPAERNPQTYAFAICYALATWSWAFAILGAALRFLPGESKARRYLADASYWIYIVHLPLVILLQGVAGTISLPWWLEYPAILAVAFPIMLGSYHVLVRYTWLGAILNGRRMPRPAKAKAQPALQGA